jgi:hypothetical protein
MLQITHHALSYLVFPFNELFFCRVCEQDSILLWIILGCRGNSLWKYVAQSRRLSLELWKGGERNMTLKNAKLHLDAEPPIE